MTSRDTYTRADMARLVGLTPDRFSRVWQERTRTQAMPAPVSDPGESLQWNRAAVDAWLASRSARAIPAPAPAQRTVPAGRAARFALAALAAQPMMEAS